MTAGISCRRSCCRWRTLAIGSALGIRGGDGPVSAYGAAAPTSSPRPSSRDWSLLWSSLLGHAHATFEGLALALVGGHRPRHPFQSVPPDRILLLPYAVILRSRPSSRLRRCFSSICRSRRGCPPAPGVAFSRCSPHDAGLNSVDRNLIDLFELYGAFVACPSHGLKLPSALPYMSRPQDRRRPVADCAVVAEIAAAPRRR